MGGGELRHLHGLGQPDPRDIDLQHIDASPLDQAASSTSLEAISPAAIGVSTARGQPGIASEVIGAQRLLQPEQAIGLEAAAALQRRIDIPGKAAIDQQVRIRADRAAQAGDDGLVLLGIGAERMTSRT